MKTAPGREDAEPIGNLVALQEPAGPPGVKNKKLLLINGLQEMTLVDTRSKRDLQL